MIGRNLVILALVVSVLGCSSNTPKKISFTKQPYFFDAGGSNSSLSDEAHPVTPDLEYTEEFGYGFTDTKAEDFYHDDTEQSRGDFLIDGIISRDITFKADIPEGDWWLTVWFELGMEDSSTTRLYINEENLTPALQTFTPEAEGREVIDQTYRLVQRKFKVTDTGFSFRMEGIEDDARLLGFSLIPDPEAPTSEKGIAITEKIRAAGVFNSTDELEPLIAELDQMQSDPELRNFAAYWKLQLEIVKEGEKFFYYRGWSHRTEETGMGLFDHIHQGILMYDGMLTATDAAENLMYERALWYNARLLYWLWLEGGSYREREAAFAYMRTMKELHPDDELVRMYNNEKIDTEDRFDTVTKPANAPEWAFAEWEVSNRLKDVVDWWVLEQQNENGEFGGKFGDDVEILRFWSPLILSGDSITYEGWKKLADGVWNSSKVKDGYAKKPSDVEHSSEFISDTAPLMVLYNDSEEYEHRLSYSADYFRNLWTGINDKGNRFFKSSWFSSSEIESEPPKNRDVPYTTRAAKAVRYYAWKSQDPGTLEALTEWADAWFEVSQKTDKGKPKGIIPASVAFPSEEFNGEEETWYIANMYWDYFDWSGGAAILDQLLFTWTITGSNKYLTPFYQHLDLIKKYDDELSREENPFEEGSEAWAAYILGNSGNFWNVVGTWRLLAKDQKYDDLIIEHGTPFIKYRLTGNEDYLVEGIQPYLETIRYNVPMISTEAIHTDRVHIGPDRAREIGILQGMITGYGIAESASPYIAVSWEKASRDLTYLVTGSDSTSLDVDIYSFSDEEEPVTMRLWQLKSGLYSLKQTQGGTEEIQAIDVINAGDRFELSIPSKEPVSIHIERVGN